MMFVLPNREVRTRSKHTHLLNGRRHAQVADPIGQVLLYHLYLVPSATSTSTG